MLQKLWLSFKTKEVSLIKYVNQQHEKVPRGEKGKLPPGGGERFSFVYKRFQGSLTPGNTGQKEQL